VRPAYRRLNKEITVSGNKANPVSIEILVGGATVLLSTASYLMGSPALAVIALVIGGISFGLIIGTHRL
jgi:hypothetical protein